MATSSILGGDWVPKRPAGTDVEIEIETADVDEQVLRDDFDAVDLGTLAAEEEIPFTPDEEE